MGKRGALIITCSVLYIFGNMQMSLGVMNEDNSSLLSEYMSFPKRTLLTAGGADSFFWVESVRGISNIWSACENQDGWNAPRMITNFGPGSENMIISSIRSVSSKLFFVREAIAGSNALSKIRGEASAATWIVSTACHATPSSPSVLLNTSIVSYSEDGRFVFDVRKDSEGSSFWQTGVQCALHSTDSNCSTHLFSVSKGTISSPVWRSSSSSQDSVLAFTNDRGSHGFVGIYARGASSIAWVDLSADCDVDPRWSADGNMLAFLRVRPSLEDIGALSAFDGDQGNRGPDFTIVVADVDIIESEISTKVATTRVRYLFQDTKYGLANFGYGNRPLILLEHAVLFGTEVLSGWLHVSRARLDGSLEVEELRPSPCEDRSWIFDGNSSLYISHNCDDIDGRGIQRMQLHQNGTVRSIESLVEGSPHVVAGMGGMALSNRYVAWLESSPSSPSGVRVAPRSGDVRIRQISDDKLSAPLWFRTKKRLVRPIPITFDSEDGAFTLHGQIFEPDSKNVSGSVVYTHGGSERQFFAAFHFASHYATEYMFNQYLASVAGIRVLSVNYRSGVGYGAAFRLCDECMSGGAREYMDVRQGALVLQGKRSYNVTTGAERGTFRFHNMDERRVAIWGSSYGGLNALQGLLRDYETIFSSALAIAPIFNWISSKRYVTDTGQPSYKFDAEPTYRGSTWRSLVAGPLGNAAGPSYASIIRNNQEIAYRASPASRVEAFATGKKDSRLLLVQGDADEEVPFEETVACVRALRSIGFEPELLVIPDETHCVNAFPNQMRVWASAKLFLTAAADEAQLSYADVTRPLDR